MLIGAQVSYRGMYPLMVFGAQVSLGVSINDFVSALVS